MKDIIIKGTALRREALILLGCLVAAEGVNIYAIIQYSRPAVELVSMIGYVIFTAVVIYLALLLVRLIVKLVCRLFRLK